MGKSILNSLLIILAFSGCYREISVDFPEHEPKIVAFAEAIVGQKMKLYVNVTRPYSQGYRYYEDSVGAQFLRSVEPTLIVNGQKIDSVKLVNRNRWYYWSGDEHFEFDYFPQANDEIELTVSATNYKSIKFKETVPQKPKNLNLESIKTFNSQNSNVNTEISYSLEALPNEHLALRATYNADDNTYPDLNEVTNHFVLRGNSPDYFYNYYDILNTDYTTPKDLTNPAYVECSHEGNQYINEVYLYEDYMNDDFYKAIYLDVSKMPEEDYTFITKFLFSENSSGDIFTTDVTIPLSEDGNGYGYLLCLNYASLKIK